MSRRGPSNTARYGQACAYCFKAKCRCVPRAEGDGCVRCHRLNKQCSPSEPLRKRNSQRNQDASERISQLEEKLDGLTSLLQSVVDSPNSTANLYVASSRANRADHDKRQQYVGEKSSMNTANSSCEAANDSNAAINSDEGEASTIPSTWHPTQVAGLLAIDGEPEISLREPLEKNSETYLSIFRDRMLPYLAFIYLPPDLTAKKLHQCRPFLFSAILTVASPSTTEKVSRARKLKAVLAQKAVLEGQSNIDLLLGVITYMVWGNDQTLLKSEASTRLLQMAISMIYDLRIAKSSQQEADLLPSGNLNVHINYPTERRDYSSLEWQRAVLGCFVYSSFISSYFEQIDGMRWTPQMDDYLNTITTNKDCPTDEMFGFQVRLQLIAYRGSQVRERQAVDQAEEATPVPSILYLKTLQLQLQDLKASLSPRLEKQRKCAKAHSMGRPSSPSPLTLLEILMAHIHYTELSIFEMVHMSSSNIISAKSMAGKEKTNIPSSFQHLESLWRSLVAIKSWLDTFFNLSPSDCIGFSFLFWFQLSRCLVTLYRLSILPDPAWDRQAVQNMANVVLVSDRMADQMEKASNEAGERSDDDLFKQTATKLRMARVWIAQKMAADESQEDHNWLFDSTEGDGQSEDVVVMQIVSLMRKFRAWDDPQVPQVVQTIHCNEAATTSDDTMVDPTQLMQSIDFGNDMWLDDFFGKL